MEGREFCELITPIYPMIYVSDGSCINNAQHSPMGMSPIVINKDTTDSTAWKSTVHVIRCHKLAIFCTRSKNLSIPRILCTMKKMSLGHKS